MSPLPRHNLVPVQYISQRISSFRGPKTGRWYGMILPRKTYYIHKDDVDWSIFRTPPEPQYVTGTLFKLLTDILRLKPSGKVCKCKSAAKQMNIAGPYNILRYIVPTSNYILYSSGWGRVWRLPIMLAVLLVCMLEISWLWLRAFYTFLRVLFPWVVKDYNRHVVTNNN